MELRHAESMSSEMKAHHLYSQLKSKLSWLSLLKKKIPSVATDYSAQTKVSVLGLH